MNPVIKLVIGLLIFVAGLAWYVLPYMNKSPLILGKLSTDAFATVFVGLFGLALLFFGLIIAWIEYEDLKWEMKEKKSSKKKR